MRDEGCTGVARCPLGGMRDEIQLLVIGDYWPSVILPSPNVGSPSFTIPHPFGYSTFILPPSSLILIFVWFFSQNSQNNPRPINSRVRKGSEELMFKSVQIVAPIFALAIVASKIGDKVLPTSPGNFNPGIRVVSQETQIPPEPPDTPPTGDQTDGGGGNYRPL